MIQNKKFCSYLFILALFLFRVQLSHANDVVTLELQSATTAVGGQTSIFVGIFFKVQKGWTIHGFDEAPQNGPPSLPKIDLSKSLNVKTYVEKWPSSMGVARDRDPKHDDIVPILIDVEDPTRPLSIKGLVRFVACNDQQCIPYEVPVSLTLKATSGQNTPHAQAIFQAWKDNNSLHGTQEEETAFWILVLLAFLAGLLLNFMPCVLPVLSLKIKMLQRSALEAKKNLRMNFIGSFLGIFGSFVFFAIMAVLLKHGSHTIGWGMHFQEPVFIVVIALLMVMFILNLSGHLSFSLPQGIQDAMQRILGRKNHEGFPMAEGFFSGIFATFLATPCTGPFMGMVLGYALSQGTLAIVVLFLCMGTGFGLPSLLGGLLPGRYLVYLKPGPWLRIFNHVMTFGMVCTILWFVWIYATLKGPWSAGVLAGLLGAIYVIFRLRYSFPKVQWALGPVVMALLVHPFLGDDGESLHLEKIAFAKPFVPEDIPKYVAKGQTVFVDITASWCLTCHMNKRTLLGSHKVQGRLNTPQVIFMQADWSKRDEKIRAYLASAKRYGIPFNQVFGPHDPKGTVLPEILTEQNILQALDRASGTEKKINH